MSRSNIFPVVVTPRILQAMMDYTGVKIALFNNDKLIMCQRDDKPGLRFAGLWDFPGGAREGNESPIECVTREVEEELGIKLSSDSITFQKQFPAMHDDNLTAYFMVANVSNEQLNNIKFGDEGQGWGLMSVDEFFERDDVVPKLKGRLRAYLEQQHD